PSLSLAQPTLPPSEARRAFRSSPFGDGRIINQPRKCRCDIWQLAHRVILCHPERSEAESKDLRFAPVTLRLREKPQILLLRARPTRKRSGSETSGERFAQDDTIRIHCRSEIIQVKGRRGSDF